jgi:hypothetical protein
MLTAARIKAMKDTEAQQTLDRLAIAYFGNDRWKVDLADLIGYSRQSVQGWFVKGNRPPEVALLLLEALNLNREMTIALRSVKAAIDLASTLKDP